MTNTEILVIGIQFSSLFFTSRFGLQFTNSNSPLLHRDKIYLPIYRRSRFCHCLVAIYDLDLNLTTALSFSSIVRVSSTSKAADGKQSNCNFDRNREEEEERLVERSRVPRASARWEGKSRKRIPPPIVLSLEINL